MLQKRCPIRNSYDRLKIVQTTVMVIVSRTLVPLPSFPSQPRLVFREFHLGNGVIRVVLGIE